MIHFEDDGKGIVEAKQIGIFEAFSRGDTKADGTGLGLHIAREYAQKYLDGDLSYQDREGGGSVFTLTFKAAISSTLNPIENKVDASQILNGKKVLLVDDNTVIRISSEGVLLKYGADVTVAEDGRMALEIAEKNQFDLVITDIFMPEMDGYELTKALRDMGFDKPIIGVTAATVGEETEQILEAGASFVMPKPLKVDQLQQQLHDYIQASES